MSASSEILVAGFHRSGTSSVAQLLHAAGLFLGDDLLGAVPSNPYGHYEDREVVQIHDQLLADNGVNWQAAEEFVPLIAPLRWTAMERLVERRRVAHRLWGFKDPRACLFLGTWKHLMPDSKVVLVFRPVSDCSYSLHRRHATQLFQGTGPGEVHRRFFEEPDLAARMWLAHNRALLAFADRHPEDVLGVGFDALQRGLPLTRLVRSAWRVPLREVATFSALDPLVTTPRDQRQPLGDPSLAEQIDDVWAALTALEARSLEGIAR